MRKTETATNKYLTGRKVFGVTESDRTFARLVHFDNIVDVNRSATASDGLADCRRLKRASGRRLAAVHLLVLHLFLQLGVAAVDRPSVALPR